MLILRTPGDEAHTIHHVSKKYFEAVLSILHVVTK